MLHGIKFLCGRLHIEDYASMQKYTCYLNIKQIINYLIIKPNNSESGCQIRLKLIFII